MLLDRRHLYVDEFVLFLLPGQKFYHSVALASMYI